MTKVILLLEIARGSVEISGTIVPNTIWLFSSIDAPLSIWMTLKALQRQLSNLLPPVSCRSFWNCESLCTIT